MSCLNSTNKNRRINCLKYKNIDLTKENKEKTLQLEEVKVLNEQLVNDLDKALTQGVKCRKKASKKKKKKKKQHKKK